MKKYFFKTSGIALLVISLHSVGFAQDREAKEKSEKSEKIEKIEKMNGPDEIIIRKKGDKNVKVTVEIRDGQVFVNDKPIDDFSDENISIEKRIPYGSYSFATPEFNVSPFRENWSYSGDAPMVATMNGNMGFLGVNSEHTDGGVKITEITKASAAEKSGLRKGDVITKVEETKIESPEDLSKAVRKHKPGEKVTVTYTREGKEQKITATLGKLKSMNFNYKINDFSGMKELGDLGELGNMDRMGAPHVYGMGSMRPRIGLKAQDTEDGKGVKVLDVAEESPAGKAGIKEDDIITEFDGKAVNSATELAALSRAAREKSSFHIKFKRGDKIQDTEVKIPKKLKTTDL